MSDRPARPPPSPVVVAISIVMVEAGIVAALATLTLVDVATEDLLLPDLVDLTNPVDDDVGAAVGVDDCSVTRVVAALASLAMI